MTTPATRPLGAVHVAAVVIGAIIGVGIFFTPAGLAKTLPNWQWILGIWLLGGIISVAGALVYADLGARFPKPGGVYVFLREGFGGRAGRGLAFLYGWLQLLVVQPGSMGIIAIVLVDNVAFLTGPIPETLRTVLAVFAIAAFTAANLLGLKTGGRIQVVAAAMKVGAIALVVIIALGWGSATLAVSPKTAPTEGSWPMWISLGLIPVLFTFGGAYHGTYIAGSVKDPERAVPRGIIAGIAIVLVGYMAINLGYLGLLGHDGLAATPVPAPEAMSRALGPAAGKVFSAIIVLSAAGILNTICLGFPFVIYAMAKDGVFFERAGELHPKTGRPTIAVAVQGTLACVAVVLGASRVDVLLVGISFADATFQAIVAIVFFRVRAATKGSNLMRAPLLAGVVVLVLEIVVAVGALVGKPRESALGAALLVVGIVAFVVYERRTVSSARS